MEQLLAIAAPAEEESEQDGGTCVVLADFGGDNEKKIRCVGVMRCSMA